MRVHSLDILRGIAVIGVLFRHMYLPIESSHLDTLLLYLHEIGWMGVDLFFVLSGFLVSGLLFKEYKKTGKVSVKRFLIRRGLKIYPSFYFFIATTCLYQLMRFKPLNPYTILAEILYVQNYFSGLWNHSWSLAVEEHFYLSIIVIFVLLQWKKDNLTKLPYILAFILLLCTVLRTFYILNNSLIPLNKELYLTHFRIDSLIFGVLISYINYYHKSFIKKLFSTTWMIFIITILISPCIIFPNFTSNFMFCIGFTILYLAFGALILWVIQNEILYTPKNFLNKILRKIGIYSYSIYLWHMPVKFWFLNAFHMVFSSNYYLDLLVYLLSSVLIGIFMSKIIEIPIIKFRDKLYPSLL